MDGADGLATAVQAVADAGFDVRTGDADLAALRSVAEVAWFVDPFGFRHELAHGQRVEAGSFTPGRPGVSFVTGPGGLGHAVLIVPDLDEATRFYVDLLGFGHSDDIDIGLHVRFLHCDPRHHTLAFSAVPGMVGVHHLMLEVADVDDVGRAHDLVVERQLPIAHEPRAAHQRRDDVVLRAHPVGVRGRVRLGWPAHRREPAVGAGAVRRHELLGPQAPGRALCSPASSARSTPSRPEPGYCGSL